MGIREMFTETVLKLNKPSRYGLEEIADLNQVERIALPTRKLGVDGPVDWKMLVKLAPVLIRPAMGTSIELSEEEIIDLFRIAQKNRLRFKRKEVYDIEDENKVLFRLLGNREETCFPNTNGQFVRTLADGNILLECDDVYVVYTLSEPFIPLPFQVLNPSAPAFVQVPIKWLLYLVMLTGDVSVEEVLGLFPIKSKSWEECCAEAKV